MQVVVGRVCRSRGWRVPDYAQWGALRRVVSPEPGPPVYTVTVDTAGPDDQKEDPLPPRRGPPLSDEDGPQALGSDDVYVGRGTRGGLPKSDWHNPHKVGKKPDFLSREQAIEAFRTDLRHSKELWARLGELSGKSLRCHCK